MTWGQVEGHDAIVERLRRSLERRRFGSSYLFLGPPGVGKKMFSLQLAQALLCERSSEQHLAPCFECGSCLQVAAGSHPDVDVVARPADKSTIPVELLIGDREHRMREGLCHRISLRPASGRRRIAIIDDADFLSRESANCLLKTLEEPPPGSVLILIGTSELKQLPTIRSRCQVIRFSPLPHEIVRRFLEDNNFLSPDQNQSCEELLALAEGSLDQAREYADADLAQFMISVNEIWMRTRVNSVRIAKEIREFVDAAGNEPSQKRNRLRKIVQLRMRSLRTTLDQQLQTNSSPSETEVCIRHINRCLDALGQIDASANLATLIASWVDDLCPYNSSHR